MRGAVDITQRDPSGIAIVDIEYRSVIMRLVRNELARAFLPLPMAELIVRVAEQTELSERVEFGRED